MEPKIVELDLHYNAFSGDKENDNISVMTKVLNVEGGLSIRVQNLFNELEVGKLVPTSFGDNPVVVIYFVGNRHVHLKDDGYFFDEKTGEDERTIEDVLLAWIEEKKIEIPHWLNGMISQQGERPVNIKDAALKDLLAQYNKGKKTKGWGWPFGKKVHLDHFLMTLVSLNNREITT